MSLGRSLLGKHVLTRTQLDQASQRQKVSGGSLVDAAVALGFTTRDELEAAYQEPPAAPESLEETGLDLQFLTAFVLRAMYVSGMETIPQAVDYVKLPPDLVEEIFDAARQKHLIEVTGAQDREARILRYALTQAGRERATEAMQQCQYTGPAPVPLDDYQAQVEKQSVVHERVNVEDLLESFEHLVLPQEILARLGPAVSAGKSILLFGNVGNGKTSVAEAIVHAFRATIYVPYCITVDGQIIKVFDPAVHQVVKSDAPAEAGSEANGSAGSPPKFDPRWVPCRRPVVVTGGELTIEMLDLVFDSVSKYYEAPAHMKANGGVFVLDDFGRQRVSPAELLNRWILPFERRRDYLTLHTGKKLQVPFDQLVVFSTNLAPEVLMDAAALRRIPYKIRLEAPTSADYAAIFRRVCEAHEMPLPDPVLQYVLERFYGDESGPQEPAGYQPKFVVEHVLARCSFENVLPRLTIERVADALRNLTVREASGD